MTSNIPKNAGFIDKNIIYPISKIFLEPIYKIGLTPNIITTITLVLRIIMLHLLYKKKNYELILGLYFISWFTDSLDGSIARKYNMGTDIGGWYDVIVDIITIIPIFLILFYKYYIKNKNIFYISTGIYLFILILVILKTKCSNDNKKLKTWEKWFNKYLVLDTSTCNNVFFRNIDPGLSYLILFIFLIVTFYKKK